jgi:hypothetical protein
MMHAAFPDRSQKRGEVEGGSLFATCSDLTKAHQPGPPRVSGRCVRRGLHRSFSSAIYVPTRRRCGTPPSHLDKELTIGPDSRFVLADPNPLVDAVHTLEISAGEAERQEAEYVPTQVAVVARVSCDDHEIRGNDRVGNHAQDRPFQGSEALGIGTGHRRRLGREAADIPDLHAAVVDSTSDARKYGRDRRPDRQIENVILAREKASTVTNIVRVSQS